jgi:hypothetical protein
MSPLEAVARKRLNHDPFEEEKNDDILTLLPDNSLWAAFKLSFIGMGLDKKWTLKSGRVVEDIMFAYGVKLEGERYTFSSDFFL